MKEIKLEKNIGYFLRILSISKSFKLEAKQYLNGIDIGVVQLDYQEYDTINNQHLYTISDFLEEKEKEEAKIIIKDKNDNNYIFLC